MVQIAAAHRDHDLLPRLHQLAPRPHATSAGWQVPPAGKPLELPALGDAQHGGGDDHHRAEIVRRLGARSAVVVALEIRGAVLGAMSLVSAAPGRFGGPAVELAAELGRRMAMALDNARLLAGMRRALYMREEFLRIASHELRTPLASLQLTAQALLRAADRKRALPPEVLDSSLRRMLGNTTRLSQLTSELLDVTRIENGRLDLNLADVALDAIVREAIGHLEGDLAVAGSPVELACAAPVYGRWDPSRLEQVVTNLIGNAAKFGAGKPIEIRVDRTGDTARLVVIDHGIGIDPALRPHIFDRFERAVPSSRYGGLGLGLYIARSIVIAHGGTITAQSELGAGSTFTVTLPCKAEARGS